MGVELSWGSKERSGEEGTEEEGPSFHRSRSNHNETVSSSLPHSGGEWMRALTWTRQIP